jgi:hypothetical protein
MLGKRRSQRALFEVGNVYDLALPAHSFHAQLARAADRLFSDGDFAAFYSDRMGRPSVPPSQLALMTLLQHAAGCSDAEAVERTAYDLRWAAVLRRPAGEPLCAKSTFQLFRAHLVLHDEVRLIFEKSLKEARRSGLLAGGPLKVASDTKPIVGRGAVQDTYNLLATGIAHLIRGIAAVYEQRPERWARAHDFGRYFSVAGPSLKGSVCIDWSDPASRNQFLTEIVGDARRLLRLAGVVVTGLEAAAAAKVREAAALLEQLLLQDVVENEDAAGKPSARLRQGHDPGRIPSATDPDVRHGRKSSSKRFDGHKASVAVATESRLIVAADVLAGDAQDATGLLEQAEQAEQSTGQCVAVLIGDGAYGSGELREQVAASGRTLVAKVGERPNGGLFPKSAFVVNLERHCVTCPGGQTTDRFATCADGSKVFQFRERCGGCELRARCTRAALGRDLRVHPQEAYLQAARTYQRTEEGRRLLRERVVAENRLARLAQLGIGQARYVGRRKTRFQLLLAATIANLRLIWNWEGQQRAQAAASACPTTAPPEAGRPGSRLARLGCVLVAALVPTWVRQQSHA